MALQCVILAGGLGTRLGDLTRSIPKALVRVAGQPFLHHQLELLATQGVRDIVLSLGHLASQVRAFVGDGRRWNVSVTYVEDGPQPLGTAGALRLAYEQGVLQPRFFTLYGDSYLPVDYATIWKAAVARPEPVTMTVLHNDNRWDDSNVCYEGGTGKVTLYQKNLHPKPAAMRFVDYGLLVMDSQILPRDIPVQTRCDLAPALQQLSITGQLAGYLVSQRFYEIGSPQGLQDLEQFLGAQHGNDSTGQ